MSAFAYISILEAVGKLAIAFLIMVSPIDRLIFYAILMCVVGLIIRFTYGHYCKKHFAECTYHFHWDKEILMKMFGFAGWNFIGAALRVQGEVYGLDGYIVAEKHGQLLVCSLKEEQRIKDFVSDLIGDVQ